jgi:deoxyribodipyrimidine photo-lyase
MTARPSLHWFRTDLRLSDNPALIAAAGREAPLACVYILDDGPRKPIGAAARWWLHHSLAALAGALAARGGALWLLRGDPATLLPALARRLDAGLVTWSRRYDKPGRDLDATLKAQLRADGHAVETFNAALLREPWEVRSAAGTPMKVFTPFWRAARASGPFPAPRPAPVRLPAPPLSPPELLPLAGLGLLPTRPDWAGGLRATWQPGEAAALDRLAAFLDGGLSGYAEKRDRPDGDFTSRLSPHLAFGEIGPRQILHAADLALEARTTGFSISDHAKFGAELGWREFAYHLFFEQFDLAERPINARFDAFPWQSDEAALVAWQRGATGYPVVDAGMRQLWQTGWMHNRVRMVVSSFLIKHLQIDWRAGERWFWDTLVDADPASNPASWQWVAGCGADAAPYYRIFNPVLQGVKFDPNGDYVRQFVPELARMPVEHIHAPWLAPPAVLARAGVNLGQTYPRPIVDHAAARARALAAYASLS